MPGGIVEAASGQWPMTFGRASQTRDGILEAREAWWAAWDETEQGAMARRQITMDQGPESRGRRTPFVQRLVALCAVMGKPRPLVYDPPSHRKYHPIERCWGLLAGPGNGTKLVAVETMVAGAKSMTWKGLPPIITLSRTGYQKGVSLRKRAMQAVAARLERHAELPNWDRLIRPASTS
jgi:hypothetical protein